MLTPPGTATRRVLLITTSAAIRWAVNPSQKAIPKNSRGVRPVSRLVAKKAPTMGRMVATARADGERPGHPLPVEGDLAPADVGDPLPERHEEEHGEHRRGGRLVRPADRHPECHVEGRHPDHDARGHQQPAAPPVPGGRAGADPAAELDRGEDEEQAARGGCGPGSGAGGGRTRRRVRHGPRAGDRPAGRRRRGTG